jgi:hypothetical protein
MIFTVTSFCQAFIFSGALSIAFIAWEIYLGEQAMTPTAIMHSISM